MDLAFYVMMFLVIVPTRNSNFSWPFRCSIENALFNGFHMSSVTLFINTEHIPVVYNVIYSSKSTYFHTIHTNFSQNNSTQLFSKSIKQCLPYQLKYFWFIALSNFHSVLHSHYDVVGFIFCSMFRTLFCGSYFSIQLNWLRHLNWNFDQNSYSVNSRHWASLCIFRGTWHHIQYIWLLVARFPKAILRIHNNM